MPEQAEPQQQPTGNDFRAAEATIARMESPPAKGTQVYERVRLFHAEYRARTGGDKYDLHYGLRQPRNRSEQLKVDFWRGKITEAQFRDGWKADANRPIDLEMLQIFFDGEEERLQAYADMRQTVIAIATDQRNPDSWQHREAEVDQHVDRMMAKLPMWTEQLGTVYGFLSELRADSGLGPVQCKDLSHATAHLLAVSVFEQAAGLWRRTKDTAYRSRTDPCYLYETTASTLFFDAAIPTLPSPNDLMALMELERAAALKALRERQQANSARAKRPPGAGESRSKLKKRAERHVKLNRGNFPGVNVLARALNCPQSSLHNVTWDSTYLKARKAEHDKRGGDKPREERMTSIVLDDTPQNTEPDPQTAAEQAEDSEAALNRLTVE